MSSGKTYSYDPSTGSLTEVPISQPSLMLFSLHLRDETDKLHGSLSFEADLSDETRHRILEWVTQMKRGHSPSHTGNLILQFAVSNTDMLMEAKVGRLEARDTRSTYPIVKEKELS